MIVLILQKVILEMGSIRGYVVNPLTSTKSHYSFIYRSIHLIQFIQNIYLRATNFVVSTRTYLRGLELQLLDCGCIRGNVIVKLVVDLFSFLCIIAQLEIHEVALGQPQELG